MPQLQRRLTLFGLTLIAVGSCIGAGIFITPFEIARAVPHGGYILIAWALGGLIALTGALTFAELGGMFPKAGGVYIFLREAYGPLAGFLYGWATLLIINTGSLAALGIVFSEYLTFFVPLTQAGKVLVAAAVILGLTLWNIRGVATSQRLSSIFTGLKLLAILGIVLVAFMFYGPERGTQTFSLAKAVPPNLPTALLTALIGVLWAFGGWHHASYLAGEAIHPQRTVPRAMFLGAVIVTVTYLLVNLSYLLLLTPEQVAASPRVAGDAVASVVAGGGRWVAGAIGISVFGTMVIYTMSAPRIYFAMARDGVFFSQMATLHSRFRTPAVAMLIQAFWAILLLLFWGTVQRLFTYVTLVDIAFMAMAGAAVFLFRRRQPDLERPYRTWGYPVVPAVFVTVSAAFVINTVLFRPVEALAGAVVLLIGVVLYFVIRKRGATPEEP
jgi:APA family basic amino acid/polyamine antiporter